MTWNLFPYSVKYMCLISLKLFHNCWLKNA